MYTEMDSLLLPVVKHLGKNPNRLGRKQFHSLVISYQSCSSPSQVDGLLPFSFTVFGTVAIISCTEQMTSVLEEADYQQQKELPCVYLAAV